MKKRSLSWKIVIGILSLSMILIPLTSSLSMAQGQPAAAGAAPILVQYSWGDQMAPVQPAAAGTAGAGGAAGLSTAAIVGIAAAVVAVGIAAAMVTNEEGISAASHH